jgi:DNA-binding LacI/PurR family transcriptional regulator
MRHVDPRLGREASGHGPEVDDGLGGRLGPATAESPELPGYPEHNALARDVVQHLCTRDHRREHGVAGTFAPDSSREEQSTNERHLAKRQLAQRAIGFDGIDRDGNLVAALELIRRQELVEALHATSQMVWATCA